MNLDIYRRVLAGEPLAARLSPRALWKLTGPDAMRYLNGQVTNDVTRLQDGHAFAAAICTAKGRMEGAVSIAKYAEDFYLDAESVLRESLGDRLDKYLIADDAVFEDVSDGFMLFHIFGATPPVQPEGGFVITHARFGLPGHDVWHPIGAGLDAMEAQVETDVLEIVRLENGIPRWGAELTTNTLPPEAGPQMLAAISYTKGCYVGQETIARLKSVGHVNRTLVFLKSKSAEFPPPGAKLASDGREAGTVTSSGYSPRLQRGIALAYVQRQYNTEGLAVTSETASLIVTSSLAAEIKP